MKFEATCPPCLWAPVAHAITSSLIARGGPLLCTLSKPTVSVELWYSCCSGVRALLVRADRSPQCLSGANCAPWSQTTTAVWSPNALCSAIHAEIEFRSSRAWVMLFIPVRAPISWIRWWISHSCLAFLPGWIFKNSIFLGTSCWAALVQVGARCSSHNTCGILHCGHALLVSTRRSGDGLWGRSHVTFSVLLHSNYSMQCTSNRSPASTCIGRKPLLWSSPH